jgi:ABC-type sugar transport system permease subunit
VTTLALGRPPRRRGGREGSGRLDRVAYPLVAPAMALTTLFFFVPMALSLYWSFTQYNGLLPPQWVGTGNYADLAGDASFRQAVQNTVVFTVVTMTIGPALGLGSALLLNRRIRGRSFFRSVFFLPVTLSLVVVGSMWKIVLAQDGLLNQGLRLVGIHGQAWLEDPSTSLAAVSLASIWQGFGFETVIFLAALQTISQDLYEAARMDGARPVQSFRAVTLPSLRPTILFVYVVGVIGAFQAFDQMYVMTHGGPLESTTTVVFYLVERFQAFDLGHASAAAYFLVVVLAVASAVQLRLGRRDS